MKPSVAGVHPRGSEWRSIWAEVADLTLWKYPKRPFKDNERGKSIYGLQQARVIGTGFSLCLPDPAITQTAGRSKIRRNLDVLPSISLMWEGGAQGNYSPNICLQDARQCP